MTDELDWILLHYGGYCCGQVEASDVDKQFFEAKQAILSDLTDIISFAEDRAEAIEKVKKYCE